MPGRANAVGSGEELTALTKDLGEHLGFQVKTECKVGRRLWGSESRIDVILLHPATRKSIGLECKYQAERGTAEEKIPATIADIEA